MSEMGEMSTINCDPGDGWMAAEIAIRRKGGGE
jgi:hypothetical protein